MSAGLEKAVLEAIDRPLHDKDPDGIEPRRSVSPSLSQKGERDHSSLGLDDLRLSQDGPASARQGAEHRTGPKGVLTDFRESQRVSMAVEDILARDEADQLLDEDDFAAEWRRKRMREMAGQGNGPTFGHFREIGLSNFERAVLLEDPEVTVVLHLFEAVRPRM
jgi:hypothetical protein